MGKRRGRPKVRIKTMRWVRVIVHPVTKVVLALVLIAAVIAGVAILHYYDKYARIIDARLTGQIFTRPSILFAAPQSIYVGERITAAQIEDALSQANYGSAQASPVGHYQMTAQGLLIQPGPESFHSPQAALVAFSQGRVAAITDPRTNQALSGYSLEPEVLTTLFDQHRDKRRLLRYDQIPKPMVEALLAIEDRDFFHHGAFNYWRLAGAALHDLRRGRWREAGAQGASTITQQVARMFFLNNRRTLRRKLAEAMIAFELEQRLTKPQIFELYANDVYMGQRGTYTIRGFGEAARVYYGEPLSELTVPQFALLAGIVQGPNYLTPFRYPKRALRRRNEVIEAMFRTGWINETQREQALATPMDLNPASVEASDAPYFVDMVRDQLGDELPTQALTTESFRVYTTLDPELQRAAARAVADGLAKVDAILRQRRTHRVRVGRGWRTEVAPGPIAQAALIAIDPHTGAIKALVGGRNYALSQLNHTKALRPTGSVFKPFVYAAALDTALTGQQPMITETTQIVDEPTIFAGGYAPHNFEDKYYGRVPLRVALEHSLNNATIALAVEVGLDRVVDLAHAAGIPSVLPTPSAAIGTYSASPLQMAGAWTIFANQGVRVGPRLLYAVESAGGSIVDRELPETKPVLDPRIAFLTTDLLESVMDHGTGVGAREDGFTAPAAGKTGTDDHDGWFAGYTSNLLCVVWVGFDNYQGLHIEGAHSALPIWAEFMKAAVDLPQYANVQPFPAPPGVVEEKVDPESQQVATVLCPLTIDDYFIAGTQPEQTCTLHPVPLTPGTAVGKVLTFLHLKPRPAPPPPSPVGSDHVSGQVRVPVAVASIPDGAQLPAAKGKKKKRGFFARLFGIGNGTKQPAKNPPPRP